MADGRLIDWRALVVTKPSHGRVDWYVRLAPSDLTTYYDSELAQSLTEALRERLRPRLPEVLVESVCFQQIEGRHPLPYETRRLWNWIVGGSLPAEEDQDWETIRSELEAGVDQVVAAQCDPERAKEETAKRIAAKFMGKPADGEAGGGTEAP